MRTRSEEITAMGAVSVALQSVNTTEARKVPSEFTHTPMVSCGR